MIQVSMQWRWLEQLEKIKPLQKCAIDGVTFLVYRAKNLYTPKWNSVILKNITREARKSYLRYGYMSLLDKYDPDAEIYLCRAVDAVSEEWLSLRFVPGQTRGDILEDLSQYICNGQSVSTVIRKKLLPKDKNFAEKLVAISRVCGIAPYSGNVTKTKITNLPIQMKYSAKSFALINKEFFSRDKFIYLLGVFRVELLGKLLRFNNHIILRLPNASKLLGCKPQQLRLDRNLLAYHFPGYFLNIIQLIDLLEQLIAEGKLKSESVKAFLKQYTANFKQSIEGKKYIEILKMIQGLDKLLLVKGKILKSQLTGDQLRALIMQHVEDGPVLKIISVDKWKKQLDKIKIEKFYESL